MPHVCSFTKRSVQQLEGLSKPAIPASWDSWGIPRCIPVWGFSRYSMIFSGTHSPFLLWSRPRSSLSYFQEAWCCFDSATRSTNVVYSVFMSVQDQSMVGSWLKNSTAVLMSATRCSRLTLTNKPSIFLLWKNMPLGGFCLSKSKWRPSGHFWSFQDLEIFRIENFRIEILKFFI